MNQNLQSAQAIALQYLAKFAKSDNFWQDFELAFGTKYSRETALNIQNQLKNSTFTIPTISIVDSQTLGTANGAFAGANQTIYLSSSFLANSDAQTIADTLIEEIGHSIDARINTKDSAGDEGQLFSALVRGQTLTAAQLAGLKAENDRAVINVGGKSLEVEKQDYTGTSGNDTFAGTAGNDIFAFGGVGIPLLSSLGIDTISNFTVGDKIKLHKSTFGAITSLAGTSIGSNFASVAEDNLVENQTAAIVYSQSTGHLFYNTNGGLVGYGSNGGLFASLPSGLSLTINDFLIVDDKINLTVSTPSITEDGATTLVYTFSRTEVTTTPLTINFNVGGTATLGTDYAQTGAATFTGTSGTVTFAPGATTATVTIDATLDAVVEASETVALTLAAGSGYTVGNTTAVTSTIVNDDTSVTLAVTPATVSEDGLSNLTYTFTRAGVTTSPLTVNYTVGGTAALGLDYAATGAATFTATTGTVTFAAGATTAVVTIDPTIDAIVENNETVTLTLGAGTGYTVGTTPAATGTILNDDTEVSLAVSAPAVDENGVLNLVYTFTRTGNTANALSVNYGVASTATLNSDYVVTGAGTFSTTGGNVVFGAGATTATVTINPTDDFVVENNETVALTLVNGTGYKSITTGPVVGTITNDDTTVTLAVSPATVTEDGTPNLTYTFTRTGILTNPLTVNYTAAGTATNGSDYATIGSSVTFGAGAATATLVIDPTLDTVVEASETVALTLATGSGYHVGTTTAVTGTIVNDDTNVTLALTGSTVTEDGTPNLVYTFTRTGVTDKSLVVNYGVSGSATGIDYSQIGATTFGASAGTVTFGIGATTAVVTINPTNDTTFESNETVALTLAAGTGYNAVTTGAITGTITNDDTKVSLALAAPSVTEDGLADLVYTFTRTGILTNPLTVNYAIGGTAGSATDYAQTGAGTFTGTTGTITFLQNAATAILTLNPSVDSLVEANETVAITLAAGSGYVIDTVVTPGAVTGTITNDDTNVTLALATTSVTEDGTPNLEYTFTRTGVLTNALTVNYTAAGTATNGTDYANIPGTITFAANSATAILNIDPTTDLGVEFNETVALTLATGADYNVGTTTAVTGTITNDDTLITLAVSAATVTEDGIVNPVYTFTRSGITTNALTVNYGIGGTATNVTDYVQTGAATFGATTGTVVFAANATTATVTINPNADIAFEADENVALTLAAGTGYNVGTTTAVTTMITNEDSAPTISIGDVTIVEGINGAPSQASVIVSLTKSSYLPVSVDYATTAVTAIAGTDYTTTGGTLNFAAGEVSKTILVPILNDNLNEANEAFGITLTAPTNATIFDNQATITITDTLATVVTSTLAADVENITLTGVTAINGTGNAGENVLIGNGANNTLVGLGGNDTYRYDADFAQGTDTLSEAIAGGTDTLDFSQTGVAVNVNLGLGTIQTVNANLKLVMPVLELDNSIGGSGNDRLTGNALNNKLEGGLGDDRIFGAAGDDSIFGGAGNDILGGGAGVDTFNYNGLLAGATTATALLGVDMLTDFTTAQDKIALSTATFSAITSAVGALMGTNFIAVDDDTLVASQAAAIVYSMSTGSLFYNQNGAVAGLGINGGEFATLLGAPTLASTDFTVV